MAGTFEDFVATRGGALWRLAWLLTGSEADAGELLDASLVRTCPRWDELAREGDAFEAAVRRELVASWLPRRGAGEAPHRRPLPAPSLGDHPATESDLGWQRRRSAALLAGLAPRERVALALGSLRDVAVWDAADALDISSAQLRSLEQSAAARARGLTSDADALLRALPGLVPEPPYDGARAQRVRRRAEAERRRRGRRAAAAAAAVTAVVAVPVLLTWWVQPASGPTGQAEPVGALSGSGTTADDVAERLVDPLPIPGGCTSGPPAFPYEVDGASAVWLRVCPPADPSGDLGALPFGPRTTLVAQEVDAMVDSWVTSQEGPNPCNYSAYAHQGLVRLQMGTMDGAAHVVDIRVGTCGKVSVDGADLAVDGRTAFADLVALLGAELAEQVDETGGDPPVVQPSCPETIAGVSALQRTTVRDLPRVRGLALPLPARAALLCRYSPVPGTQQSGSPARVEVNEVVLDPVQAERLRTAYLAHPSPHTGRRPDLTGTVRSAGCAQVEEASRYAVLMTDVTGSRRAFTVDLGRCARVDGPLGDRGTAGLWLLENLTLA